MLAFVAGCSDFDATTGAASTHSASTATAWFRLQLELVQHTPGFSPPVASRAFAYAGVALYEAVVPGMPQFRSFAAVLDGFPEMPEPSGRIYWPAAVNHALAEITRDMFASTSAENVAAIDALEAKLAAQYATTEPAAVLERSAGFGDAVAATIFEWSRSDHGHEAYLDNFPSYVPPRGDGLWVPTPPTFVAALQPYWGQNRTFCLATAHDCDIRMPPAFSREPGSQFFAEAKEVYDVSKMLTPDQQAVALFWADESVKTSTPAGHSISILTQFLEDNDASLDLAAEAYAKLGLALGDSFIATWAMKYRYNVMRPITYIRAEIDPQWNPMIPTPPFPEYPSGHSVQFGATAQVLTRLFGATSFTDDTFDPQVQASRWFPSFWAAAEEAALSRLYAGIHFRAAVEDGLEIGRCVGECVNALPLER